MKVLELIVDALIASEKMAKTLALAGTPLAPSSGLVDTTLGPVSSKTSTASENSEVSPVATLVAVAVTTSPAATDALAENVEGGVPSRVHGDVGLAEVGLAFAVA